MNRGHHRRFGQREVLHGLAVGGGAGLDIGLDLHCAAESPHGRGGGGVADVGAALVGRRDLAQNVALNQHPQQARGVLARDHRQLMHIALDEQFERVAERVVGVYGERRGFGELRGGDIDVVAFDGGGDIGGGDQSDEAVAAVGDGDDIAARLVHRVGEHLDAGRAVDDWGVGAHGGVDAQLVELRAARLFVDAHAGAAQADVVDGVAGEQLCAGGGERDGGEQRDEAVVAGQLEDDEERGHRRAGGGGEDRRHADDGVGAERSGVAGDGVLEGEAEQRAAGRADEEQRGERAARRAGADRERRGDELEHQQDAERGGGEVAGGEGAHLIKPRTEDAVVDQRQRADRDQREDRSDEAGEGEEVEEVFGEEAGADEEDAEDRSAESDQREEREFEAAFDDIRRQLELGLVAVEEDRDEVGDDGGDDDDGEVAHVEAAQDDFEGEEGAGDGCVEGGGDAAGGTGRDHQDEHVGGLAGEASERGGERGGDQDDRALASGRAAAADREGGRDQLERSDERADVAAGGLDRHHRLRHARAARIGREASDDQGDGQRGDGEDEDQRPAAGGVGQQRAELVEGDGELVDGELERDGAKSGGEADGDGEDERLEVAGQAERAEPSGQPGDVDWASAKAACGSVDAGHGRCSVSRYARLPSPVSGRV